MKKCLKIAESRNRVATTQDENISETFKNVLRKRLKIFSFLKIFLNTTDVFLKTQNFAFVFVFFRTNLNLCEI